MKINAKQIKVFEISLNEKELLTLIDDLAHAESEWNIHDSTLEILDKLRTLKGEK